MIRALASFASIPPNHIQSEICKIMIIFLWTETLGGILFLMEFWIITVISGESSINFLMRKPLPFKRKRKKTWDDDEMNCILNFKFICSLQEEKLLT